jgi:hypothetical protein
MLHHFFQIKMFLQIMGITAEARFTEQCGTVQVVWKGTLKQAL